MAELTVGGDCEAYCTTCKTMKDHVIVAMVGARPAKVECAGCHKQHVYRAGPPGAPKEKSSSGPRTRKSASGPQTATTSLGELEAKLAGREADAQAYSPAARYTVDDVVRHPSFGVGMVTALPGAQKVEITFRGGRKLLQHDKGNVVVSTLERPRPREDDGKTPVTDAPPGK